MIYPIKQSLHIISKNYWFSSQNNKTVYKLVDNCGFHFHPAVFSSFTWMDKIKIIIVFASSIFAILTQCPEIILLSFSCFQIKFKNNSLLVTNFINSSLQQNVKFIRLFNHWKMTGSMDIKNFKRSFTIFFKPFSIGRHSITV